MSKKADDTTARAERISGGGDVLRTAACDGLGSGRRGCH